MSEEVSVAEFLNYLGSERGLARNTLLAYDNDLKQFFVFCQREKITSHNISLKDLRKYLATIRKNGLSQRSLARKLSAVKQYFKFLMREELIDANPTELLSVTIRGRELPEVLKFEEIERLISSPDGVTELGIRDRALLELWYATGARVSELVDLETRWIDWKQSVVKIRGKGGRERLVPVHPEAMEWCRKYRTVRHRWMQELGPSELKNFFLTRTGKVFTRQAMWKLLKRYAKKAGITRKVWPHLIRHSFATHVLEGGADLRSVQELLGHRSIATTEVYTHLDIENLKVMQLKYHPRG